MTQGEMKDAQRRALNILGKWIEVTGAMQVGTSWYYELQSIVEDAVHCGAQAALGIHEPLDVEKDD